MAPAAVTESERSHSRLAAIFAGGTIFSRVLGLARDITWVLIPEISRDAFILAFRFPNMLRDLIGEGASNAAFVPVFSEAMEKRSQEEFRRLVAAVMSAMLILLIVVTGLGLLVLPWILGNLDFFNIFSGTEKRSADYVELVTVLSVVCFPYLFFIGMAVFCMAPLYTMGFYFTPSWSPALLNIALIAAVLLFRNAFAEPAYALVLGLWVGGLAQLVMQYAELGRKTGVWRPNFQLTHPGIRTVFWLLGPVLLGQAAGEVNKLVDALFAASLQPGTQTHLFYANRMVQLPLAVFGVATSVAILPSMSRSAARLDRTEMRETLLQGLRQSYFLIFPAMVGLIVLAEPIIRLLFERNYFTSDDTARTATAVMIYGLGLLSFAWVKVLVTGFYAEKNTRTPVIIASVSMVFNILLNFVLVGPLQYRGLAWATTISFTMNALLLYLVLSTRLGWLWDRRTGVSLLRTTMAAFMMAAVAYGAYYVLDGALADNSLASRATAVLGPIVLAVGAYAALCAALRVEELKHFVAVFRRRSS